MNSTEGDVTDGVYVLNEPKGGTPFKRRAAAVAVTGPRLALRAPAGDRGSPSTPTALSISTTLVKVTLGSDDSLIKAEIEPVLQYKWRP